MGTLKKICMGSRSWVEVLRNIVITFCLLQHVYAIVDYIFRKQTFLMMKSLNQAGFSAFFNAAKPQE